MVRREDNKALLLAAVPKKHRDSLQKAIEIAERNYGSVIRLSGESLLEHVLRSARYYAELRIDFNGVIATLLHHTLPKQEYENKEIFNDDILQLLHNVELVFSHAKKESVDTQVIYKYILSFRDDIRIALIKLSEKFDNAKTIDLLPEEKRKDVARRLLHIYAPLAEYMNLSDARREFELNGFRVYYPKEYEQTALYVHKRQADIFEKIEKVKLLLGEIGALVNVDAQIWGRAKSYYSIWRKLYKHDKEGKPATIDALNDLLAFTILVDSVDQCYAVAYALKDYAEVSDDSFEDYIQNPKPNGFSEIQMICEFPELLAINIEVQILTNEMYWHNTYGPAAHLAYKLEGKRFAKQNSEFQWVETVHKAIEKSRQSLSLPISKPLQLHLFQDRIFAFTPKHRIVELPVGATVIDFAYQVHTSIGDRAVFADVNGKKVQLDEVLKNGDIVEIITDNKKLYPTEEWLESAKTKNAQARIKLGLRKKKFQLIVKEKN